jgi:hypothetical protein
VLYLSRPFVSAFLICTYVQYSVGYHCKILYFNMFCCAEYGYRIVFYCNKLGQWIMLKRFWHCGVSVMCKLHLHASEYIWFIVIWLTRYSIGTFLVTTGVKVGRKFLLLWTLKIGILGYPVRLTFQWPINSDSYIGVVSPVTLVSFHRFVRTRL